jgi:hypothetical protein
MNESFLKFFKKFKSLKLILCVTFLWGSNFAQGQKITVQGNLLDSIRARPGVPVKAVVQQLDTNG